MDTVQIRPPSRTSSTLSDCSAPSPRPCLKPNPFGEARPREEILKERGCTTYREEEERPYFRPQFQDRASSGFHRREIWESPSKSSSFENDRRYEAKNWRSFDYAAPCNGSSGGGFGNFDSYRVDNMTQSELAALFSY
jgi:hypothetical protein